MSDEMIDAAVDTVDVELAVIGVDPDKGPGEDQGELRTFLGRRNVVRLGAPRSADYLAELRRGRAGLPDELRRRKREGYGFVRVRPTLTLLPDHGCAFVAASLGVELRAAPASVPAPGGTVAGRPARPIACDIQPEQRLDDMPYSDRSGNSYEVNGETKAGLGRLLVKMAGEHSVERNGVRKVPRLYSHGCGSSDAGWRLRATVEHELVGDVRDLELVAEVPPGVSLVCRFHIAAEIAIHAAPDRWLTASFGPRRRGPVLDVTYPMPAG